MPLTPILIQLPSLYGVGGSDGASSETPGDEPPELPRSLWLILFIGLAVALVVIPWTIREVIEGPIEHFIASREFEGAMPERNFALWWMFVVMMSMIIGPLSLFALAFVIGSLFPPIARVIEFRLKVDPLDPDLFKRRYDLTSIESYSDGLGIPQEIEDNLFVAHPLEIEGGRRSFYIERRQPPEDQQSMTFSETDRHGYSADLSLRFDGQDISARLKIESRGRLERLGIRLLGLKRFDRICARSELHRLSQLTQSTVSIEGWERSTRS